MEQIQLSQNGITYNVYMNGHTMINGVPENMAENLLKAIMPRELKNIIINNSGPEQSGCLSYLLKQNPNINIISTPGGLRNIREIINADFNAVTAKENGELDGFLFKVMPGYPWPDAMVTYCRETGTLFSGDMFSSENGSMRQYYEKYFKLCVNNSEYAIGELKKLDIREICPSYGDRIYDAEQAFSLYEEMGKNVKCRETAVIYCSRSGYTKEMAETAAEEIERYMPVRLVNAENEDAVFWINNSKAVCIGTPTIYRDIPKCIISAVVQADLKNIMGKPFMIFGSYGWSGEAMTELSAVLKAFKADVFEKPFRCIFRADDKKKNELKQFAKRFAEYVSEESEDA